MRFSLFLLTWLFTIFAAVFDAYFAWNHRAGLQNWELNPFICWLAGIGGIETVLGFKAITTIFATGIGFFCRRRQHWLAMPFTLAVAGIFIFLSVYYVIALHSAPPWQREENSLVRAQDQPPRHIVHAPKAKYPWHQRKWQQSKL
jgi:hypothetical protein